MSPLKGVTYQRLKHHSTPGFTQNIPCFSSAAGVENPTDLITSSVRFDRMNSDLLYQVALTLVPNMGPVQAKILLQHCNAEEIFHAKKSFLEKVEGIGPVRAKSIRDFKDFKRAEEEIRFIEKYKIQSLFLTDPAYPKRLLNCYDSPTLLYYKGDADLNAEKIIAIIGTRANTDYGRQMTETLVNDLADKQVLVISGLAVGIDAIAHRAALINSLPTVGVLAHGLDQVYPPHHGTLAKEMIKQEGGLLTEFTSRSKPDKHNFPSRNRIVAGMSDAVIVIETGTRGGSMITAELANGYNKDVFAFPGKSTDPKSAGCNYLIRNNKAILLNDAAELLQSMQWDDKPTKKRTKQTELFIELNAEEKIVVAILKEKETVHIDEINAKSRLSSSLVAGAMLNLELKGIIVSSPGKMYRLS